MEPKDQVTRARLLETRKLWSSQPKPRSVGSMPTILRDALGQPHYVPMHMVPKS